MNTKTNYIESKPNLDFQNTFYSIWYQTVNARNVDFLQPVFPDGCVEIVWRNHKPPVVAGVRRTFKQKKLTQGLNLAGIRFLPGQAGSLLGVPLSEITDREVPLHDIIGSSTITEPLHSIQKSAIEIHSEMNFRIKSMMMNRNACANIEHISTAILWLAKYSSGEIKHLANSLETNERALHRQFARHVGIGPKLFQRIVRFQKFLYSVRNQQRINLAMIALDLGYSDQAHLNRECRELSGRSPLELIEDSHSTLAMSDLFNTNSKR